MSKYSKLDRTPTLRVLLCLRHRFDDGVKGLAHPAEFCRSLPSAATRLPLLPSVTTKKKHTFCQLLFIWNVGCPRRQPLAKETDHRRLPANRLAQLLQQPNDFPLERETVGPQMHQHPRPRRLSLANAYLARLL